MRIPIIQCYSVNNRGTFFLFFTVLLLSSLSLFTEYVSAEEAQQEAKENNEKIVSILQKGVGLLKYEIQRDQEVASRRMLISTLRQLRITLKKDIDPKEKLINNLKVHLAEKLTAETGSIQKTLEQEKTIIENIQTSKRVRRVTRNTIKGLIPIKEQVLASFEKFLSEVIIEQGSEKTSK